jgi:hypothetical protein
MGRVKSHRSVLPSTPRARFDNLIFFPPRFTMPSVKPSQRQVFIVHTPLWNSEPAQAKCIHLRAAENDCRCNQVAGRPPNSRPEDRYQNYYYPVVLLERKNENWKKRLMEYLAVTEGERDLLLSCDRQSWSGYPLHRSQIRSGVAKLPQGFEDWIWQTFDKNFWSV